MSRTRRLAAAFVSRRHDRMSDRAKHH